MISIICSCALLKKGKKTQVFKHAESKSGFYFGLSLFLWEALVISLTKLVTVFLRFLKNAVFLVEPGSQVFRNNYNASVANECEMQ